MKILFHLNYIIWYLISYNNAAFAVLVKECSEIDGSFGNSLPQFSKSIIPELKGKIKGEAGKIGIIGGSTEYTGAPYFAAISALKVGADLVFVITTENAAPVIKSYSPDLIVYPYLSLNHVSKISSLLNKMDVIVIGPGLGREDNTAKLINDIIKTCNDLAKPLVVDADGLYFLSKNLSILKNYPSPGAILTPNIREAKMLREAVNNSNWLNHWGEYVSVLVKGEEDKLFTCNSLLNWSSSNGGSGRRVGGQGDILSGSLGTFFNWALKARLCENDESVHLAHSVAAYAAAKFTRECNSKAFAVHGRSLTASDMLNYIHFAFDSMFPVNNL